MNTRDQEITTANDVDPNVWYRFKYTFNSRNVGLCWLKRNGNVLFVADRPDNTGMSVINAIEHIALQAIKHFDIKSDDLVMYEYLPDVDQYDQVFFGDGWHPTWRRADKTKVPV